MTYYHLVDSYREGKKVRQRTLLSLSKTGDGTLNKPLFKATAHYQDVISIAELAKEISVDKTFILGPLLKELREVRAIPVKIRGRTVWTRTDITRNAAKLFRALKIPIPPKILKYTP